LKFIEKSSHATSILWFHRRGGRKIEVVGGWDKENFYSIYKTHFIIHNRIIIGSIEASKYAQSASTKDL